MNQNMKRLMLLESSTGTGSAVQWEGGRLMFEAVSSSWGGGSVKLQVLLLDGTTWVDVGSDTTLTADGIGGAELPICSIRAVATTATGVTAAVRGNGLGGG